MNNHSTEYAQPITVRFAEGIDFEAYVMPDGEVRYALSCVSIQLGCAPNWLTTLIARYQGFSTITGSRKKSLESLQDWGFNSDTQTILTERKDRRGKPKIKTISGEDLDILVMYAAVILQKPKAIALHWASFREVRNGRERHAQGLPELPVEEKQRDFKRFYELVEKHVTSLLKDFSVSKYYGKRGINSAEDMKRWNSIEAARDDLRSLSMTKNLEILEDSLDNLSQSIFAQNVLPLQEEFKSQIKKSPTMVGD